MRSWQGWEPSTHASEGWKMALASVLPTLSHRTRKDGAPPSGDTPRGIGKGGPPARASPNRKMKGIDAPRNKNVAFSVVPKVISK